MPLSELEEPGGGEQEPAGGHSSLFICRTGTVTSISPASRADLEARGGLGPHHSMGGAWLDVSFLDTRKGG